jgi:hypothetical protein
MEPAAIGALVESSRPTIASAFRQLGLDPEISSHRELLLVVLAQIVFGPKRRGGRRKGTVKNPSAHWHSARLFLLGVHFEKVVKANPGISDRQAGHKITKQFPYPGVSPDTIRKRLPAARKQWADTKRAFEDAPRVTRLLKEAAILRLPVQGGNGLILPVLGLDDALCGKTLSKV